MEYKYPFEALGKYVSVQGGFAFKSRDFQTSGVPVLKIKNVRLREVDTSEVDYVDEEVARSNSNYFCKHGDLLISMTGSGPQAPNSVVGRVARFTGKDNKFLLNQRVGRFIIKNKEKVDARYLFYVLTQRECQWELVSIATGSANQANISVKQIESLGIPLPPLDEQKAIAHILGTLDDKIELNQHMNRTLEGIARAIFKSWFIDFDPVRAKMDGRQPAGMDAETAALFPDEFEDSPLGKIPKGWRVETLKQVVSVNPRSVTKSYSHQVIQYVDISSVTTGHLEKTTAYQLSDAPSRAKRLVRHGDTIWSGVRPNRRSYLFIHTPPQNLVVSTGFVVLSPKAIPPSYLYAWVTTDEFVDYLTFNADGSAYPAVRPDRFSDAQILIPLPEILENFEFQVGFIRDKIFQNNYESMILGSVRDILLPKLLSTEIRVKDIDKILEAVA